MDLEIKAKLLRQISYICLEDGNRVWDEIYNMLEILGVEVPSYIEYDQLWRFLAIEHGTSDDFPLDEDEVKEYWDMIEEYKND